MAGGPRLPVNKLTTNEITAKIRKIVRSILPISIDIPANPVAPNKSDTRAKMKKPNAILNMLSSYFLNKTAYAKEVIKYKILS